jgi:hypothetical protein
MKSQKTCTGSSTVKQSGANAHVIKRELLKTGLTIEDNATEFQLHYGSSFSIDEFKTLKKG